MRVVTREDERVEIRWKLWLREKARRKRLMEEMIKAGEIVGTVRSECWRTQCGIVFRFGFSNLIQAWHDLNDGLDENVTWRHGMTQALAYRCMTPSPKTE